MTPLKKNIVILRGKPGGILKESELIILADSLRKYSLTTEDFKKKGFYIKINFKNIPKEHGDEQHSHKYLPCFFRSILLPIPAPMRIFTAFPVISFPSGD